ncbi:MAG: tRNA (N6-isopentenyl adenosine(37)-C2)-methylthiotransferase MiaB, partial [Spirochaetales bacterium]
IEAYMYYWNSREGTKACDMENQIPEDIKQARLQALIDWLLDNAARIKAKRARGIQKVLVTRVSRDNGSQMLGRNEHSEMVAFDVLEGNSPGQGDMVDVDFKILNGNTFIGKQVQT